MLIRESWHCSGHIGGYNCYLAWLSIRDGPQLTGASGEESGPILITSVVCSLSFLNIFRNKTHPRSWHSFDSHHLLINCKWCLSLSFLPMAGDSGSKHPPQLMAWVSRSSRRLSSFSLKEHVSKIPSLKPVQKAISTHVPHISIEFAPAKIPRKRRLQTAAVAIWALMMPICLAIFFLLWCVAIPEA